MQYWTHLTFASQLRFQNLNWQSAWFAIANRSEKYPEPLQTQCSCEVRMIDPTSYDESMDECVCVVHIHWMITSRILGWNVISQPTSPHALEAFMNIARILILAEFCASWSTAELRRTRPIPFLSFRCGWSSTDSKNISHANWGSSVRSNCATEWINLQAYQCRYMHRIVG